MSASSNLNGCAAGTLTPRTKVTDRVNARTRSRMMRAVKGFDTYPETAVRRALHRAGLRFGIRRRDLPGRPDVVLPARRAVVFVHGCFWHQHPDCPKAQRPLSNMAFWQNKLDANIERDARNAAALHARGWRVFIVWECQLDEKRISRLVRQLASGSVCG